MNIHSDMSSTPRTLATHGIPLKCTSFYLLYPYPLINGNNLVLKGTLELKVTKFSV